jgi:nucleoside-diphosphate-sugar epimerase
MLIERGHRVRALARSASTSRLPTGCTPVVGDALDASTFSRHVDGCDTFVQLVGTPHPSPSKIAEFERVDLASVRESVRAAATSTVTHFIYLSVAPSTSVMRAYVDVRMRGEALVREWRAGESNRRATFLRPWYVLGPGHRWPYALVPLYWIAEAVPSTRERARQLGLVTISQMVAAIVRTVEEPGAGERNECIVGVPEIRTGGRTLPR